MRPTVLLALAALAVGCGSTSHGRAAGPQVVRLRWHENCGTPASPLPIDTSRLALRGPRWSVRVSFRNETGVALRVFRPHVAGGTLFGLEPFKTTSFREVLERAKTAEAKPRTIADRFRPPLPRVFRAGQGWSGSFSGTGVLPAGKPVRVVLGRFVVSGPVPRGFPPEFLCVSERYLRLG